MPKYDPESLDMRPKWREKRKSTILCMVSAVLFATFLLYLYVANTYTPEAKVEDLSSEAARVEAQVPVRDSKSSVPDYKEKSPVEDEKKETKEEGPVEDETKETAPVEDESGSKESVVDEKENQELNAKGDEEQEVKRDEDSAVKTEKQEEKPDAVDKPTDEDELDETEDNKPDGTPAEEKPADEQKPSETEEKPADEQKPSETEEKPSDEQKPSETETPVEKLADEQKTKETEILAFPDEVVNKTELELTVENKEVQTNAWASQANESKEEKKEIVQGESQPDVGAKVQDTAPSTELKAAADESTYNWKLCTFSNAADYIPCLDNQKAIKKLKSRRHYEHRERHCPTGDDIKKCLVPLPQGYQTHVNWPQSRKQVWYNNVPHPGLVSYKKDQNWVKKKDDLLIFPGGGTQFKQGAERYIEFMEISVPEIAWGKHTRTVLDVGCGVASFGGFLFDKDVLTMSLAPKDEHDAQVQLALERGIPAILAVMGTQRLVYPSNVYDLAHCARCRVPWHADDGRLLLELNRLIRPGGYFVWSATPVYKNEQEDKDIWRATKALMDSMCWKMVRKEKDPRTGVGIAVFQKPLTDSCYEKRSKNYPPLCEDSDNPDAAWYVPMQSCLHKLPRDGARGTSWPQEWPQRLNATPSWLSGVPKGLFGKPASEEFQADTVHWRNVVEKSYARGLEIDWTVVRNVMDMKAGYGGFAAALVGRPVWVMNVVPITEPDTLPIIFERGLIGQYHDWCESFSTYPRTYDLLHADHLFSRLKQSCGVVNTILEMDRILRPGGWGVFRDTTAVLGEIEPLLKSLHWEIRVSYSQDQEQLIAAQKTSWRPES